MDLYIYITIIIVGVGMLTWYFVVLPTEKRIEMIRQWLLQAVVLAEQELGSKTGVLKLSKVYDMFITKFPLLSKIITFKKFESLVEDAVKELEVLIDKNVNVENYIKYSNKK